MANATTRVLERDGVEFLSGMVSGLLSGRYESADQDSRARGTRGGTSGSWTEDPVSPSGESDEEILEDLSNYLLAFTRPVLEIRHEGNNRILSELPPDPSAPLPCDVVVLMKRIKAAV